MIQRRVLTAKSSARTPTIAKNSCIKLLALTVLVLPLALASCGSLVGPGCTSTVAYLALELTAQDSITGALTLNALIRAVGQGPDSASVSIGSDVNRYPVNLAGHVGTYAVTVQSPGYVTWSRSVVVTGVCVPKQVTVVALMQKSP